MDPHDDSMEISEPVRHPAAADLAAFADDVLAGAEKARLEAHLADCPACRRDLRIATEATRRMTKTSRGRWFTGTATVLATAAAIALLLLAPDALKEPSDMQFRGPGEETGGLAETAELIVVAPEADAELSADNPRFTWRSAGDDAQYRFHLTKVAGDPVAIVTTSDTVIATLDARLIPGTDYFWWVDALREDGSTAETGLRRVRVIR